MMRFFWLFLLIPLSAASPHKYYVSTADIYFSPDKERLQLVVRVFTDDLQLALSTHAEEKVTLDPNNVSEETLETIMSQYFKENFFFHNTSDKTIFSFVGWEYKQDKTFLYATYKRIGLSDNLSWSNTFLMDVLPDQKNIVTLNIHEVKKSFLHTQDQILAQYSF